jgi:hypothetical protein
LRVAHRARLILSGLVVERGRARRCSIHIRRMTAKAQEVDVVDLQQAGVGRAMRRVTRQAAFIGLHRSVLENERPHFVSVAFGADRELTGGSSHLVTGLGPVRIVTVAALNESDIDTVPVRPGEFGLLRGMAPVAQLSLWFHQQEVDVLGSVGTVTVRACDAIGEVLGFGEVLGLQAGLVALGADRCRLRRTQLLKTNDLGDVSAAINMGLRRSVTGLASMLATLEQRRMRRTREMLVPDFLVAGLANVGVGILAICRTGKSGGRLRRGITRGFLGWNCTAQAPSCQECSQNERERSVAGDGHPCS